MSIIEQLKQCIDNAEVVVIGAGAGLSSAAGFEYGGKTFMKHFKYMYDQYGYKDMYTAGFHPFQTSEEKWGYWSKFIYLNRYSVGATPLYQQLLQIVKRKDYFVLTTNVDHQFQLAGFDKERLFYTQGDYGLLQCANACHAKTYDNQEIIESMIKQEKDGKIPHRLIPICPFCKKEMDMNLRKNEFFVEDEGWHQAARRYHEFIQSRRQNKILFLELGVGYNTPSIIKYPFWQMTYSYPYATYACINLGEIAVPKEIQNRSICINDNIEKVIQSLL